MKDYSWYEVVYINERGEIEKARFQVDSTEKALSFVDKRYNNVIRLYQLVEIWRSL